MARARELLAATDLPIGDVAQLLGFHSQSHFGQVFRAATGATPTAYRRARRDG
jgi:AraC family transcriptional regulator